jgi:hypothetical protein
MSGKVTLDSAGSSMPINLTEGTFKGDYVWDTKAGMLRSMVTDQKQAMSGDMGGGEMTIKSTAKTTITRK